MNTLTHHLDVALDLLGDMLKHPRFDSALVEVWRGRQLEGVRRNNDDPGRLAFTAFNRLMFGDHPIGWEMDATDLEPEDPSRASDWSGCTTRDLSRQLDPWRNGRRALG